ncbi:centromere protein F-like [Hemiscyllium ocellatum]|uniref:centromere protein F-like n=1 Tax=Hemiscyllium ocellatum TaxID=170820 RepID=UPI002966324C|nr:centromere protein F-like [Hemiscyllium ocellatum]XP_060711541.1 centromere protein F-like [Hemiscyllium ocellatum]
MSWAVEEWKSELSSKALQKISEYETQLEKLKKERQQKQLQLDSLEDAFRKHNQKLEDERNENVALKRDTQGLTEARNSLEKAQQRLCHEIQVKEALVCSLEGQLLAAKKQIDNLEQELKRLEAELERSQRASTPTECQLHLTPAKIYPGCSTLSRPNEGSRLDELQEKYNQEIEEKKRLVSEVKALKLQVQQLQFSSNKSHRESAPQQIRASTFSWQQEGTPTRVPESPVGRGSPSSVFPWEQPRSPPYYNSSSQKQNGNKSGTLGSKPGSDQLSPLEVSANAEVQELRKENQVLQSMMSELEVWVHSQEKEIKNHLNKLQEVQSHLEKSRTELAMKEQALAKSRDDLMRATIQQEQNNNKCAILEQKLKQVAEELSCQRQNAESARRLMEQKLKDKEKEHQQELSDQQRAYRNLEHQCKQEKNQLNQEIQKLKNEHLALQSTMDKMAAQRQQVDRELEEVKTNFHCAEKELATYQRKGDTLQKSLQEALEAKGRFADWHDQSTQRIMHLEAQLKKLEKELARSQKLREGDKFENMALASKLNDLQKKLDYAFQPDCRSMHLSPEMCKLNRSDGNEVNECDIGEEQENSQSNDEQSDNAGAVVGLSLKAGEEMLGSKEGSQLGELPTKSVSLDQDSGTNLEKDPNFNIEIKAEVVQRGTSTESQSLKETRNVLPDPEEKMGTQFQEVSKETIKELEMDGLENAAVLREPVEKGEGMIDLLDKPITVSVRLRECEVELDAVKSEKQMLQQELDDMKQTLDSKVLEGRKNQQTIVELRRKLKKATQKRTAETEHSTPLVTLQAGQISALEKDLEHERVKVARLQETNRLLELECSRISDLTRSIDGHVRPNEDEIQILQNVASKKIERLEQQIVDLNSEKTCIEEIIKASSWTFVAESSDLPLENLQSQDAENLEVNKISPNHLGCDSGEMLEQKLNEERDHCVEVVKAGNERSYEEDGRELFLEQLKHKVAEQLEFDKQSLEHLKQVGELKKKCQELTTEKEQEEKAKRQAQENFDSLQSRIHRETQQLTVALETQSKNIEGLLLSMEEKDQTIQVLNGRLQDTFNVLSCLQKENFELKTNLKVVLQSKQKYADSAALSRDAILEQTSEGSLPQGDPSENESGNVLSVQNLGLGERAAMVPADGMVQNSEPGHSKNVFDTLLLPKEQAVSPALGDQCEETKMPSDVLKLKEDPEIQAQQHTLCYQNLFNAMLAVPKEQGVRSVPAAKPTSGTPEMPSTVNSANQDMNELPQDIENQGQPMKLNSEQRNDGSVARHSISLQGTSGSMQKELLAYCIKKFCDETETLIEEGTTEIADSKLALALKEKKPVDELRTEEELVEEVERVIGKLTDALHVSEEELKETKELNQQVVSGLNKELNLLRSKCARLEQEKEQLHLEVQKAQETASDKLSEKEDLMNAIQSSEARLRASTEEKSHLKQELKALRDWKQKVLEDGVGSESRKESGQGEPCALQESVLKVSNQIQRLEEEHETLKNIAETAKHSQKQLQEELETIQSKKSALQNQVDHLQKRVVELNRENMELRARLKLWERNSAVKEDVPKEVLRVNGLHKTIMPEGSQQQDTAQVIACKLGANLEALRQTVQGKREEIDNNLLSYSDLQNKDQEVKVANKILSKALDHFHDRRSETVASGQWPAARLKAQSSTEERKPDAGRQIGGDPTQAAAQDQKKSNHRSKGHSNPEEYLVRLNPAELAMQINTAELAARLQRNWLFRHHVSVAFDETEYEPYGLPDVVQKGFADIPSGPSCPHVLRRATINTTLWPQQQKEGQSVLAAFKALGGSNEQ